MNKILFTACCVGLLLLGGTINAQVSTITNLEELNQLTDSCSTLLQTRRGPCIGISASQSGEGGSSVPGTYIHAVLKAGGTPVIIPLMNNVATLREIVAGLDGLIMTGGEDVNPRFYKEQPIEQLGDVDSVRDVYDLMLIKMAADRNIPLLGICRGEQLINVAFGGSLYQDIPSQHPSAITHRQSEPKEQGTHTVTVSTGSLLASVIGDNTFSVNSFHHQAIKKVAPNFRVVAWAPDSTVEAIEAYPGRSILAVQWHPEGLVAGGDTTMLKIFKYMIHKSETYRKAKELHQRILSVDTHCDTPLEFRRAGFNIGEREENQVNIPKMEEGKLDAIFLAAYVGQGPRDNESLQKAVDRVTFLINGIYSQVKNNSETCGIARTVADLQQLKSEGKKAIFIGIENGYGIGKDIANLSRYKAMGVNYMTLCHTKNNDICDTSNRSIVKEWGGLSPFGYKVVKEMNRLGMVIDISHAGDSTFWDVINSSKQPIVATHSATRALCNRDRNLTDQQMKALAKNGGVIQVCPLDEYINANKNKASLEDFLNHIDHAVKVAGIDHVGIGSDFDGGGGVPGINGTNDMINITTSLLERGYTEEEIGKIWGGNFFRVLSTVQAGADKSVAKSKKI